MAELLVIKTGFSGCYDSLMALSSRFNEEASAFTVESMQDTSQTGEYEQMCYTELVAMMRILAALAEETAKDVRLTQARYVLADE